MDEAGQINRRRMEELVLENEARLDLQLDGAYVGLFEWHLATNKSKWSEGFYTLHGLQAGGAASYELWRSQVHPDDIERVEAEIRSAIDQGESVDVDYRTLHPDGRVRWTSLRARIERDGQGVPMLMRGYCGDITRRKLADAALLESDKLATAARMENAERLGHLAAIVSNSDDVIVSKDLNGIVTSWNASATRVFGYSAEEMIGTSILKLIPEHLHSDETMILESIRAGRAIEHYETVRRAKDGSLVDVSLTISPIKDDQGRVVGASKILRNISERKRIEQSLVQAEKIAATGRMAATIAHEINNPLEAVMNLLYLLRPLINDPAGIQYLQTAEAELVRVSHIAKQTLGYYREHAEASHASVAEILRQAIEIYEPRCASVGIEIRPSLESSTKILLRRGEMMQVVSNLIANSIYGMPQGGVLTISVADADVPADGVVIKIEDNGVGIDARVLPKVFDAFFTTRSTVGTGIGLFVAKQFVEGHGGRIEIESKTDTRDHGTRVRICLPLRTAYDTKATEALVSAN